MKLFLSYGHDRNTPLVLRIKRDLEAAGHSVWIDSSEIKTGEDWRRSIVDGLADTDWTLGFLSRHSVRSPGVCLDELAIALHVKGGAIATILVEAEAAAEPPVSVSQVQWLDMHDWAVRMADAGETGETWYRARLNELLSLLANPKTRRFAGEIEKLDRLLRPSAQDVEIGTLVDGFIGRDWLQSALDDWCKNAHDSRLFWISGAPGTGKSAFAAWLAHKSRLRVIGVNFCRYNIEQRRDPARVLCTLAFQIATRLPDFRRLLLDRLQNGTPDEIDGRSVPALFDSLLVQPLRLAIDGGRRSERYLLVIDALDETIRDGRSSLTEVLAEYCHQLPEWLAVVVSSRPEPSILRQFAGFKPHVIETESAENLDDLRAYVRRWLAIDSLGAGETQARVERIVAASEGNFLYLRMLQASVTSGLMDLANPDHLPRGLIGLYERYFRRQFPDSAAYDRIRPLLEVVTAAGRPLPEQWLSRIFAWSVPERARMLEPLGSLLQRRESGVAPFHKSLRDWLADDRAAGSDFVVDVAIGANRLTDALLSAFASWIEEPKIGRLDSFCLDELTYQTMRSQCDVPRRDKFIRSVGDSAFITRFMMIDTTADEDQRRAARHWYRGRVTELAQLWPKQIEARGLWNIVETFTKIAWRPAATDWDAHAITIWDDIGRPADPPGGLKEALIRYREWVEGILLLTTAVDLAHNVASARSELVPHLPSVLDERLFRFVDSDAQGFVTEILTGTGGRDYIPERNMSFLCSAVSTTYAKFKDDSRLGTWAKMWAKARL